MPNSVCMSPFEPFFWVSGTISIEKQHHLSSFPKLFEEIRCRGSISKSCLGLNMFWLCHCLNH